MKETMDGAVKSIEKVAQQILPTRPHHLSVSTTSKFPKPDGFWFTGRSGGLQYMTLVSDADRGILITRPSYEICEEPESVPVAMPVKVLAKGEVKKKLSIKDYQKKKNSSASPTDNDPAVKQETRPNGVAAHTKAPKEEEKKEDFKFIPEKHAMRQEAPRSEKAWPETNGDRLKSSQQKPHAESDSRKRYADTDGNPPPQKRVKSESITARPEIARAAKPDTPRDRDRNSERPQKSAKGESLHPTANGLAPSTVDRDRENTASPRSTIQVNGSRPRSDSGRSTPRRMETSAKAALPVLLSPLHPSLVAELNERDTGRKRVADKAPARPPKSDSHAPTKRPRQSYGIPQLLSPTLPPIVEAELARLKKTPPKGETGQRTNFTPESPGSARKPRATAQHGDQDEEIRPSKPSRIVTIKLKKPMAKRAKELLSLPSRSAKDALRKERSLSEEGTPPPAKKRPRMPDETVPEPSAPKRSKVTGDSVVARPLGPSTPLKQSATAMSRVTSSQSQGTPGNSTSLTATPGAMERPPTRADSAEPGKARDLVAIEAFRKRQAEYSALGSSLKHQRDDITRNLGSGNSKLDDERRATALHFEMIMAYMVSFYSLNQSRILDRKPCDFTAWESLQPHFHELRRRVQSELPLRALTAQLNAVSLEQVSVLFQTADPANPVVLGKEFSRWTKLERLRPQTWAEAVNLYERVSDPQMKTMMGPWTKVEDAVMSALGVLQRWTSRHSVQWRPVIMRKPKTERAREQERPERRANGGGRDRDRD